MLFSEPKIPQSNGRAGILPNDRRFSALQRAENSSIGVRLPATAAVREFQCSSASRKFLNRRGVQRDGAGDEFQCSSASRKFLNVVRHGAVRERERGFSALQRAENSSIRCTAVLKTPRDGFSALQRAENSSIGITVNAAPGMDEVSVLFSEPKIPQ